MPLDAMQRRKVVLMLVMLSFNTMVLGVLLSKNPRECWRDPDRIMEGRMWDQLRAWGPERVDMWKEAIGFSRPSFEWLCEEVREDMEFSNTRNRSDEVVSCVEERVACGLYQLHHGVSNTALGHLFRWGKTTCGGWTLDLCRALQRKKLQFIAMPTDDELREIEQGFEAFPQSRLAGCVGAIDGTHIPFKTSDPAYKNYKRFTSIVAQALVDDRLLIRNWVCGHPGSWSDKKVWQVVARRAACSTVPGGAGN